MEWTLSTQPIIKLLTSSGIGSRRQMADAIKKGKVTVNGEIVESFLFPVNPISDRITINGESLLIQTKSPTYLMLNKPKGIVSTTRDDRDSITVLNIIPQQYRKAQLYPVGRLDKDSTGLILLTDDGELTYRLTHPKFEKEKEYLVQVKEKLKPDDIKKIKEGVLLDEGLVKADRLKEINTPPYNYSVIIHEGKKRQIRRMFATLGHRVIELKRVRIDNLKLGTLTEGRVRELTTAEVKALKRYSLY